MIPTNKEVQNILENARKHTEEDKWIDHCIYVGDTGAKIAEALVEKGYNVDPEKTRILGYVHDIGKMIELPYGHEINGYNYMKEQGYDEDLNKKAYIKKVCKDYILQKCYKNIIFL